MYTWCLIAPPVFTTKDPSFLCFPFSCLYYLPHEHLLLSTLSEVGKWVSHGRIFSLQYRIFSWFKNFLFSLTFLLGYSWILEKKKLYSLSGPLSHRTRDKKKKKKQRLPTSVDVTENSQMQKYSMCYWNWTVWSNTHYCLNDFLNKKEMSSEIWVCFFFLSD